MSEDQILRLEKMIEKVDSQIEDLVTVLSGTPAHPETGLVYIVKEMHDDLYSPEDKRMSLNNRIKSLEDDRLIRKGSFNLGDKIWTVLSVFGGAAFLAWVESIIKH